jgi:hypothetical protein
MQHGAVGVRSGEGAQVTILRTLADGINAAPQQEIAVLNDVLTGQVPRSSGA